MSRKHVCTKDDIDRLSPYSSQHIYIESYLEPHLKKALDSACVDGMERLFGYLSDEAARYRDQVSAKDGKAIVRFLKSFEQAIGKMGIKGSLETGPKGTIQNRLDMERTYF